MTLRTIYDPFLINKKALKMFTIIFTHFPKFQVYNTVGRQTIHEDILKKKNRYFFLKVCNDIVGFLRPCWR